MKFLWLAIPAVGVAELLGHLYFSRRAPRIEEWRAVAAQVASLKREGDLLVIAPAWAEPLARNAFGDALLPISEIARPDETGYSRVIEVSALGESNPLVARWPVVTEVSFGRFDLRTRRNPSFRPALFVLTDHATPPQLSVTQRWVTGQSESCSYGTRPASSMSGLLARPALPRQRFACGPAEGNFVGTTIIEDQQYRARRCLWANPSPGGLLTLTFPQVPIGEELYGYVGFPYFRFRDRGWSKVDITFTVDETTLGSHSHLPELGWQPFRFSTTALRGTMHEVRVQIFGADSRELELCFYAATR